jgi:hypothetical protein
MRLFGDGSPLPRLVFILSMLCASQLPADYKRDYGSGVKAYNSGEFVLATTDLEKAITENPVAEEKVRIYGMRFEPYMPHYFLGAARHATGDCAGAVDAWAESVRQGVIVHQPQFAELTKGMSACGVSVESIPKSETGVAVADTGRPSVAESGTPALQDTGSEYYAEPGLVSDNDERPGQSTHTLLLIVIALLSVVIVLLLVLVFRRTR